MKIVNQLIFLKLLIHAKPYWFLSFNMSKCSVDFIIYQSKPNKSFSSSPLRNLWCFQSNPIIFTSFATTLSYIQLHVFSSSYACAYVRLRNGTCALEAVSLPGPLGTHLSFSYSEICRISTETTLNFNKTRNLTKGKISIKVEDGRTKWNLCQINFLSPVLQNCFLKTCSFLCKFILFV